MQIRDLGCLQVLADKPAQQTLGGGGDCGSDGCIAWSIGFADAVRSSSLQSTGTISPPSGKIRGTLLF